MSLLLGLLGGASMALSVIYVSLRKAPEAYEDEQGFHLFRKRAPGARVLSKRHLKQQEATPSLKSTKLESAAVHR